MKPRTGGNVHLPGMEFADAVRVFEGPTIEQAHNRVDYGEGRTYAIGLVNGF